MPKTTNAFDIITEWATAEVRKQTQVETYDEKVATVGCIIGVSNINAQASRFKWSDKTIANVRRFHEQFQGAKRAPASQQRQNSLALPAI